MTRPVYWVGSVPQTDDFKDTITDEFIDGITKYGPWAMMTPASHAVNGVPELGLGRGQRYKKQPDGKWLKVEG